MSAPVLNYSLLSPILILLGGALLAVLVEALFKKSPKRQIQFAITLAAILLAFVQVVRIHNQHSIKAAMGAVAIDGVGLFIQGTILVLAFFATFFIADQDHFTAAAATIPGSEEERSAINSGRIQTEVFPLILFAVSGALLFPVANDLITMFVALEVLSLPLYLVTGLSRRRRLLSQEAALKYFLLGAFSSAFFLFGSAFIYGYAGSVNFGNIADAISSSSSNDIFLLIGIVFIAVGMLFKIGAAPFHAWTPDVYQGAPTPITGFMAACVKAAAFGAMLRLFYVAFGQDSWQWRPLILAIAIITMIVGAVGAIAQRDIKRMLAFSSITHAGFLLAGVLALNGAGIHGALFYVAAYGFATIGAFGIITLVRDGSGEVTDLNRWVGLGKKSPIIAGTFVLFLLSFAGIPLTAGFVAKFAIFAGAYAGGNVAIVIAGVLTSAVTIFFYARVAIMLFFNEPKSDSVSVVIPSLLSGSAIAISAAVTLILGIYPSVLLDTAARMVSFVR
jgi:NADH-quinone oxidoreductase subunit N